MNWEAIRYRDFYDLPRIFITTHNEKTYLFDCPFDDEIDDYSLSYHVYELPVISEDKLQGSWEGLSDEAVDLLGTVPVDEVEFDPSKRERINTRVLDELLAQRNPRTIRVA